MNAEKLESFVRYSQTYHTGRIKIVGFDDRSNLARGPCAQSLALQMIKNSILLFEKHGGNRKKKRREIQWMKKIEFQNQAPH